MSEPVASLAAAVARLRAGLLVAFPTETVWGLAADASSPDAVARLQAWKGRGPAQPLSVLVAEPGQADLPPAGRRLAEAFWPGPLTLVASGARRLAPGVAREDGALGWRCSSHATARALAGAAAAAGLGPLTATSLNRSGEPPAGDRAAAAALCAGPDAPALLDVDGPDAGGQAPSTVVDVTGPEPRVLREGAVPAAELRALLEERRCA